ncbi:MAG: hypothetical protein ABR887_04115 [Methanoregulaceae archaeon]
MISGSETRGIKIYGTRLGHYLPGTHTHPRHTPNLIPQRNPLKVTWR